MELLSTYLNISKDLFSILKDICNTNDYKAIKEILLSSKFNPKELYFYLYFSIDKRIENYDDKLSLEWELGINSSIACNYGHTLKDFAELYDKEKFYSYMDYLLEYENLYEYLKGECQFKYPDFKKEIYLYKRRKYI